MSTTLDQIAPIGLGERLRIARDAAKVTQAAAAASARMARTTLVAIEQGHRRIRLDELQQLAKLVASSTAGSARGASLRNLGRRSTCTASRRRRAFTEVP